jgi:hypothetical protein
MRSDKGDVCKSQLQFVDLERQASSYHPHLTYSYKSIRVLNGVLARFETTVSKSILLAEWYDSGATIFSSSNNYMEKQY